MRLKGLLHRRARTRSVIQPGTRIPGHGLSRSTMCKNCPLLDCKCRWVLKSIIAHANDAIHSLFQGWGCLDRKGGVQESRRALAEGLGLSKISVL